MKKLPRITSWKWFFCFRLSRNLKAGRGTEIVGKPLNRGSAINFFSETDTLRLVYSVLQLLLFLYPLLC